MNDERTPYRPIGCEAYSEYERAIMHRQELRLTWRALAAEVHLRTLPPLDLETRKGEEFLLAGTLDGQRLRLHWMVHCEPLMSAASG